MEFISSVYADVSDTSYVKHPIRSYCSCHQGPDHLLLFNPSETRLAWGPLESLFSCSRSGPLFCRSEFPLVQMKPVGPSQWSLHTLGWTIDQWNKRSNIFLCPLRRHATLRWRYSYGISEDGPVRSRHHLCLVPRRGQRLKHYLIFSLPPSLPDSLTLFS